MKLMDILKGINEGVCERLPNESDEDFLTRCGNGAFAELDRLRMNQTLGTYSRNVMRETRSKQELEYEKMKLFSKALRMMPNSQKQLEIKRQIDKINALLKHLKESNNTNPSTEMRDEPHPTRHETEHPPIEKTAFRRLNPFKEPTKK